MYFTRSMCFIGSGSPSSPFCFREAPPCHHAAKQILVARWCRTFCRGLSPKCPAVEYCRFVPGTTTLRVGPRVLPPKTPTHAQYAVFIYLSLQQQQQHQQHYAAGSDCGSHGSRRWYGVALSSKNDMARTRQ